jgi:hypothetical protein
MGAVEEDAGVANPEVGTGGDVTVCMGLFCAGVVLVVLLVHPATRITQRQTTTRRIPMFLFDIGKNNSFLRDNSIYFNPAKCSRNL